MREQNQWNQSDALLTGDWKTNLPVFFFLNCTINLVLIYKTLFWPFYLVDSTGLRCKSQLNNEGCHQAAKPSPRGGGGTWPGGGGEGGQSIWSSLFSFGDFLLKCRSHSPGGVPDNKTKNHTIFYCCTTNFKLQKDDLTNSR